MAEQGSCRTGAKMLVSRRRPQRVLADLSLEALPLCQYAQRSSTQSSLDILHGIGLVHECMSDESSNNNVILNLC